MSHAAYLQRLVQGALSNDLSLFRWWLMYSGGELRDGVWKPLLDLHPERCEELVLGLDKAQLADLCWRGMIPDPQDKDERSPAFFLRVSSLVTYVEINYGVTLLHDPLYEQVLYDLSEEDGGLVRLRFGDLEILEAAGYPETIPDLIAALWVRIAPAPHAKALRTAHDIVRHMSAILHSGLPNAATLARLREVVLPFRANDQAIDRMVAAEQAVIAAAIDAVSHGQVDQHLTQAVERLIEARNI